MEINKIENPLEKGTHYKNYLEFLQERDKISSKDLEILAENFSIPYEKLINLRKKLREIVFGEEIKESEELGLVTTYHLNPWELDYYFLASERIKLLNRKIFSLIIAYTDPKKEKLFNMYLGDKKIDLRFIFDIKNKTETSYGFYLILKSKFLEFFEEEENFNGKYRELVEKSFNNEEFVDKKIKNLIDKFQNHHIFELKELSKEDKVKVYIEVLKEIFYLLGDFFDFFEGKSEFKIDDQRISLDARWNKIHKIVDYIIQNEDLKPIIEKLGIEIKKGEHGKKIYPPESYFKLIFLLLVIGGVTHIGAEWATDRDLGKYNKGRKLLGLPPLPEIPPGLFVERFNIIKDKYLDSLSLRLLFGDLKDIWKTASVQGDIIDSFSPINEKLRKRIKIIDFWFNYKKFLSSFNEDNIELTSETIKEIIIAYFNKFLKGKVSEETFSEKVDEFFANREGVFKTKSLIREFNNFMSNQGLKNHVILDNSLKILLIDMILPKYVNSIIDNELLKIFNNLSEQQGTIEGKIVSKDSALFGGIKIPLSLPYNLTSDDLLIIKYLSYKLNTKTN